MLVGVIVECFMENSSANSTSLPRLVVVKSSGGGGLGDSIRTLVTGIDYALKSGRSLHVDWSDGLYGPVGENVFDRFFELTDLHVTPSLGDQLGRTDVYPPAWQGHLDSAMKDLWSQHFTSWNRQAAQECLSFDQTNLSFPQGVLVMWDFDSFFSGPSSFADARQLLKRHLRPSVSIRTEVDRFVAEQGTDPLIGLHIRNSREAQAGGKSVASDRLLKKALQVSRQYTNARFLICTDNGATLEQFQKALPRTVVRPKPLPPPGEAIHLVDYGPSAYEKTCDALIELLLLSRCDALIYPAASSFSLCSALISDIPEHNLFPVANSPASPVARLRQRLRSSARRILRPFR
jgi:hypothetical protein